MDATVAKPSTDNKTWNGGNKPLNASSGKMMMWLFIVSDALTFSGFHLYTEIFRCIMWRL